MRRRPQHGTISREEQNFFLDETLIDEAQRLRQHKTAEQTVTTALEEYIRWRKQYAILESFGTVDFDSEYDDRLNSREIAADTSSKIKTESSLRKLLR